MLLLLQLKNKIKNTAMKFNSNRGLTWWTLYPFQISEVAKIQLFLLSNLKLNMYFTHPEF